ncbi:MAG: hypothetical protein ACREBB_02075 [Nitrosotalea sp.]
MTKMISVNIETPRLEKLQAKEWVDELTNVYADMEIKDINISENKISFKVGFSGMDDTESDDIKMKIEEYLSMNEMIEARSISCQ